GQQIYERIDGREPQWRLVYPNTHPGRSETGLRGLTAVPGASGGGQVLLVAAEGSAPRVVRGDPKDGSEATDLDLAEFLNRRWQTQVGYVIAAYNDMTKVRDLLLMGLETFIPPRSPVPDGHRVVDIGRGWLEAGGWYLVRYPGGRYDLRSINTSQA